MRTVFSVWDPEKQNALGVPPRWNPVELPVLPEIGVSTAAPDGRFAPRENDACLQPSQRVCGSAAFGTTVPELTGAKRVFLRTSEGPCEFKRL